jgi:hypothetical protein
MGDIVATVLLLDMILELLPNWRIEIQMKKKGANPDSNEVPKIYRKASQKDIDIWSAAREREEPMKVRVN